MSDATLAIWISCGSLLVSAGSLVVCVAAYRRSDTLLRRLGRLGELTRDIADLRPRVDQLERTIPEAVQSRVRASAATGHGLGGAMTAAAGRELRGQLHEGASLAKRVDYAGIETKSVTARQVGTRLEQLVQYMRDRAGRPK